MSAAQNQPAPLGPLAGVGLRAPHYDHFVGGDDLPQVGWVEVHAENYFEPGGIRRQVLLEVAQRYPVSLHGVALSLGSAEGLDPNHLDRLAALAADVCPVLVSEHLAWSRADGIYYNDLLPLPLTEETLDVVSANVERTQARLGRPILVENPSGYMHMEGATLEEAAFLSRLVARTGCGLLVDINNLYVSAFNLGVDADAWLDAVPSTAVGEIHLAGHAREEAGDSVQLIDTHGAPVAEAVWNLYARAIDRLRPRPTLIEWDSALPPLEILLAEAAKAQALLDVA
ncbi:MAG TPA: DUF692 domain-containing protein [Caulobacteraceae bacterium]|nr:DUF692 domain-containing protein [Caulobacteraceae bacterium]